MRKHRITVVLFICSLRKFRIEVQLILSSTEKLKTELENISLLRENSELKWNFFLFLGTIKN
jgi:hypothetical protein